MSAFPTDGKRNPAGRSLESFAHVVNCGINFQPGMN